MHLPTNTNVFCRILVNLPIYFLLLACSACQSQDITPEWWITLPGNILDWKEPLTRILVLLIPCAIVFAFMMSLELDASTNDSSFACWGCVIFLTMPYIGVVAFSVLGLIFLSTISYGLAGIVYYVGYTFACFCAGCFLIAVTAIVVLEPLVHMLMGNSILKKGLGLIGLIIEGFEILFTFREIYNLIIT
jgi:hypothetical protein